jgi:cell shape-determining protein MreD
VLRYAITLFFLILLTVILQQFAPAFISLYNARVFLLLVVFLCIAVTVPLPVMFIYALICGFLWDAQCAISSSKLDPSVYTDSIQNIRFGSSILLFGLAGALMNGFQPIFRQGKWYLSALLTGISTFLYCLAEYSLLDFLRGSFTINHSVMLQISYTALFSLLVAPLVFILLFFIARISHYQIVVTQKRTFRRFE